MEDIQVAYRALVETLIIKEQANQKLEKKCAKYKDLIERFQEAMFNGIDWFVWCSVCKDVRSDMKMEGCEHKHICLEHLEENIKKDDLGYEVINGDKLMDQLKKAGFVSYECDDDGDSLILKCRKCK